MDVRKPRSTYHGFLTCILDLSKMSISPCLLWSPNRLLPWSFACRRETSRSSSSRRVFVGINDLDQLPTGYERGGTTVKLPGVLFSPLFRQASYFGSLLRTSDRATPRLFFPIRIPRPVSSEPLDLGAPSFYCSLSYRIR